MKRKPTSAARLTTAPKEKTAGKRAKKGADTPAAARSTPVKAKPAGYSGTALPKKLGIKPHTKTFVSRAPADFESTLGELPEGAVLTTRKAGSTLAAFFLRSRAELAAALPAVVERAASGSVWLAWPKLSSRLAGDLSEGVVRAHALERGIVDYKVAAIDETWSGLAFAKRKGR
jgi:hypothetical protein